MCQTVYYLYLYLINKHVAKSYKYPQSWKVNTIVSLAIVSLYKTFLSRIAVSNVING